MTAFYLPYSYLHVLSQDMDIFLKIPPGQCAGTGDLQGEMNMSRRIIDRLILAYKASYCRTALHIQMHTLLQR